MNWFSIATVLVIYNHSCPCVIEMEARWKIEMWILAIMLAVVQASNTTESKVLIVGAGISGITAAKTLADAGYSNFLIIEGSSRVGGRLKSSSLSGYTVEHGAMWIYGKGTNPIHLLSKQYGISRVEIDDTMTIRNSTGHDVTTTASDAMINLGFAIDSVNTEARNSTNEVCDFSLESRLRYYNWSAKTDVDEAIEIYNIDYKFAAPPTFLSGKHAYFWAPYDEFGSDKLEIMNDPNGFESLVQKLGEGFLGNGSDNEHIIYNKKATEIRQTKESVKVKTSDGTIYTGDYVIVTASLGVLQSKDLDFIPELPACKQKAIDQFGMGDYTHIYIKFPSQFWDNTSAILYASPLRGKYPTWINMNKILPGSNILQLSLSAEESRRVERQTDQIVIDDIMVHLRLMYQDRSVPDPENFVISKWTYDPLFYGAYSNRPTGFTNNNMLDMMGAFGRVFFAGDHLDPIQYGYAHGAYASGRKTGQDVRLCLENEELCAQIREIPFPCSAIESECLNSNGHQSSVYACFGVILLSLYISIYE